jgi:hypothetical protein
MRVMSEQPTTVERKETVYQTVCDFWQTYGDVLQQVNGPDTFKYALVQKMKQMHEDNVAGSDGSVIHRKILDILGEQRISMIQFESCLTEFNRYLEVLRLLDTFILHGICMNNICPCPSERNHDEREQVQRLLAFLASVMSLQTQEDRIKTYQETWAKLHPYAKGIVWKPDMSVCFPWDGKTYLWRTLHNKLETRFKTVICEHLNGEFTNRPIVEFSFMHYNEMLFELLDIYLKGLDDYIYIQDMISAVTRNMDAHPEDERYVLEKRLYKTGFSRTKEFLDVILFMHTVPQRADGRWDTLDREHDVTWFREHCKVYQENQDLMAFLRDCAVVVLLVGHFHLGTDVQSIHHCYTSL